MKPTLVTSLAVRYLCSVGPSKDDALDGLMACCWRAKGSLYIKPDKSADRTYVTYTSLATWEKCRVIDRENNEGFKTYEALKWAATHHFISARLQDILSRYDDLILSDIYALAESGHLRWIAREVRNKMADHLRAQYKVDEDLIVPDPETPARTDTKESAALVLNDLERQKTRLVRLIGPRMFDTLSAVVRHYPFGDTLRERKGNVTRAIATERGVSEQQARADKRELMENAAQLDYLVCRTVERFIGPPELSFRDKSTE